MREQPYDGLSLFGKSEISQRSRVAALLSNGARYRLPSEDAAQMCAATPIFVMAVGNWSLGTSRHDAKFGRRQPAPARSSLVAQSFVRIESGEIALARSMNPHQFSNASRNAPFSACLEARLMPSEQIRDCHRERWPGSRFAFLVRTLSSRLGQSDARDERRKS